MQIDEEIFIDFLNKTLFGEDIIISSVEIIKCDSEYIYFRCKNVNGLETIHIQKQKILDYKSYNRKNNLEKLLC